MFRPSDTPNCESTDVELFFVPDGQGTYPEIKALKKICGACVVQKECLDYALKYSVMGYWGNSTETQRNGLRRQLNITPIPMHVTYK
jgi:WhiB family redox-sensing transcriptional regulator